MPISPAIAERIESAPVSAHLATSVDDRPHVAPIWYGYLDGILFFITAGRKLANLRANPRVALSIERSFDGDVEWNVLLRGTATIHENPGRIDWASSWIYDKYDGETDAETGSNMDGDETGQTDGGDVETNGDAADAALVAVTIGSGAVNVYD